MCAFKTMKPIHLESAVRISLAPFKDSNRFTVTLFCGGDRCHGGIKKFKSTVTRTCSFSWTLGSLLFHTL